jgi:signal transduction histidine kinase
LNDLLKRLGIERSSRFFVPKFKILMCGITSPTQVKISTLRVGAVTAIRLTQRRWAIVAIMGLTIVGGATSLAIISANYYSLTQSSIQAKNAILALSDLEGNLKDAETGQRGYLLTGNPDYLDPYITGAGLAQANLVKLELLFQNSVNVPSKQSLEAIQRFSNLKLEELEQTIKLRRSSGLNAALPIIRSNAGKTYMDAIRTRSNRIRFAQESILSTNAVILNQLDSIRNGILIIITSSSVFIFWLLFKSFKEELSLRKKITTVQEGELRLKEEAVTRLKIASDLKEKELSLRIHDWKNPLSGILSSVELLYSYSDKLSQEKIESHYKKILGNIYTLLDGFNDALLVARAEAGKLELELQPVNVVTIAKNSISAIEYKLSKSQHTVALYCALVASKSEIVVQCDHNLVQRALINLLENALKHTRQGEIGICIFSASRGGACIQVGDQGRGIPQEDLQRLFIAFERGNTQALGTGLGLAVVKHCAEAHGGSVKVESQHDLTLRHPDAKTYSTVFTLCI